MSERLLRGPEQRPGVILLIVLFAMFAGCAQAMRSTATTALALRQLSELWIEPIDIATRDLLDGPGGPDLAPAEGDRFKYKDVDVAGFSDGYDVTDATGREWSIKLGAEVQSEIAASRLLWAIGYHQPPIYLVRSWYLTGGPRPGHQRPGRFRPELPRITRVSDWSWQQNPFVGTQPFRGLLVVNLVINNWDLKTTNNKVYKVQDPGEGPEHWYVVRDLGAAFGKSRFFPYGTRNNLKDFESQKLVNAVEKGRVRFDYHGRHRELLEDLAPRDVVWACQLLARLSDRQLKDAFLAAGYGPAEREGFTRKLKAKIAEGLALGPAARSNP